MGLIIVLTTGLGANHLHNLVFQKVFAWIYEKIKIIILIWRTFEMESAHCGIKLDCFHGNCKCSESGILLGSDVVDPHIWTRWLVLDPVAVSLTNFRMVELRTTSPSLTWKKLFQQGNMSKINDEYKIVDMPHVFLLFANQTNKSLENKAIKL